MRTRPLRRTLAVCAIALTTAGLLSACSNSDGASDGPDSPTTASSAVFPVSVEHAFGETLVPDEPRASWWRDTPNRTRSWPSA